MAATKTRRPRGAGTVYQRHDGRPGFIARLTIDKVPTKRSFPTRDAAESWLELNQPLDRRLERLGNGTLGAWLVEWLKNPGTRRYRKRRGRRASTAGTGPSPLVSDKTAATYRSLVSQHWLEHPISKKPLTSVTVRDIDNALDSWDDEGTLSPTTIGHLRRILSAAYTAAVERDLVAANPVLTSGYRTDTPNRVTTLRLTEQLGKQIEAAVRGSRIWPIVVVMLNTGLRPAEALGLDWQDVEITVERDGKKEPGSLHVRQAVLETRRNGKQGWYLGEPKTKSSQRELTFDDDLVPVLFKVYREAGKPKRGLVFPKPADKSKLWDPPSLAKEFSALLTTAEIALEDRIDGKPPKTKLSPRDLRSLHASIQIDRGASIADVSRRLGHSDPATTLRRYISVPTRADRELGDRSGLFGRRRPLKESEERDGD